MTVTPVVDLLASHQLYCPRPIQITHHEYQQCRYVMWKTQSCDKIWKHGQF